MLFILILIKLLGMSLLEGIMVVLLLWIIEVVGEDSEWREFMVFLVEYFWKKLMMILSKMIKVMIVFLIWELILKLIVMVRISI